MYNLLMEVPAIALLTGVQAFPARIGFARSLNTGEKEAEATYAAGSAWRINDEIMKLIVE